MLETWTLAVFGEMYSASAICRLLRPAATSARTSTSRGVSPNSGPAGAIGGSGADRAADGEGASSEILARCARSAISWHNGSATSALAVSAARCKSSVAQARSAGSRASAERSLTLANS